MIKTVLHIDASARRKGSVTRELSARIVARHEQAHVITRDLAKNPLPHINEDWVTANFTPHEARSDAQRATLAQSDALVDELESAETIVIGLPIYNFGVPAALKAWIDLVARAGRTFRYTENGPEGLLGGKQAIIAVASGGTEVGSDIDFATPYIRHALGFLGITDIAVVAADQMAIDSEASLARASTQIDDLRRAA